MKNTIKGALQAVQAFQHSTPSEIKSITDILNTKEVDLLGLVTEQHFGTGLRPEEFYIVIKGLPGKKIKKIDKAIRKFNDLKQKEKIEAMIRIQENNTKPNSVYIAKLRKNAEVFTEALLIESMINNSNSSWDSTGDTIADIACGRGTLLLGAKTRLMESLKYEIEDEEERERHIVENMLFGYDSSEYAVKIAKGTINPNNKYNDNIEVKDMTNEEAMKKFNKVLLNPPFQHPNQKGGKIWKKFLAKSIELAKSEVIIITPVSLYFSNLKGMIEERESIRNNIVKISFNINQHFDVGEDLCYTIINKNKNDSSFEVELRDGTITKQTLGMLYASKDESKPIGKAGTFTGRKIFDKVINHEAKRIEFKEDRLAGGKEHDVKTLLANGTYSETKTKEHIYPILHTTSKLFYSNVKYPSTGKLKVMVNFSSSWYINDKSMPITTAASGKQVFHIEVKNKEEGQRIRKLLSSKLYRFFMREEQQWGGWNTGRQYLPHLDFSKTWTDAELYEEFNLTKKEINWIESVIK